MTRIAFLGAVLLIGCQEDSGSSTPPRSESEPEAVIRDEGISISATDDGALVGSEASTDDELTDDEIRDQIIARSIASYSGNCPCPYNTDSAGRRCGGRSAYSRPGGASPLCYRSDISDEAVAEFRGQ